MTPVLKLLKADLTPQRQLELIKLTRREIVSLAELIFALGEELVNLQTRLSEVEKKLDGMKV